MIYESQSPPYSVHPLQLSWFGIDRRRPSLVNMILSQACRRCCKLSLARLRPLLPRCADDLCVRVFAAAASSTPQLMCRAREEGKKKKRPRMCNGRKEEKLLYLIARVSVCVCVSLYVWWFVAYVWKQLMPSA